MSARYIKVTTIDKNVIDAKAAWNAGLNVGYVYQADELRPGILTLTSLNGSWSINVPDLGYGIGHVPVPPEVVEELRKTLAASKNRKSSINQQVADLWSNVVVGCIIEGDAWSAAASRADEAVAAFKERLTRGDFNV